MPCSIHGNHDEKMTVAAIMSVDWSWCKCMDQEVDSLMNNKKRSQVIAEFKLNAFAEEFIPSGQFQDHYGESKRPPSFANEELLAGHGWGSTPVVRRTNRATVIYSTSNTTPTTPPLTANEPSNANPSSLPGSPFLPDEALRLYRMERTAAVDVETLKIGTSTYQRAPVKHMSQLVGETARIAYNYVMRDIDHLEPTLLRNNRAVIQYVQEVVKGRIFEMKRRERAIDTKVNYIVAMMEHGMVTDVSYEVLLEHLQGQDDLVKGIASMLERLLGLLQMKNVDIWDVVAQLKGLADV